MLFLPNGVDIKDPQVWKTMSCTCKQSRLKGYCLHSIMVFFFMNEGGVAPLLKPGVVERMTSIFKIPDIEKDLYVEKPFWTELDEVVGPNASSLKTEGKSVKEVDEMALLEFGINILGKARNIERVIEILKYDINYTVASLTIQQVEEAIAVIKFSINTARAEKIVKPDGTATPAEAFNEIVDSMGDTTMSQSGGSLRIRFATEESIRTCGPRGSESRKKRGQ